MDVQRLRNLTTNRLHTEVDHIYKDLEHVTGFSFLTHELPNANKAAAPYLKTIITDERFWDGKFDQTHCGEIDVPAMNETERAEFVERMNSLPSLLAGKKVIVVQA